MLLTITTTAVPATDLGYLLHKHPDRVQEFSQSCGTARVVYPEAETDRCTAALMLEIDPVKLARSARGGPDFALGHYVNDRSYAASSLLAVALGDVFRTARTGRCPSRPALASAAIPLEIGVPVLPCRGGPQLAQALFAPLGWDVDATQIPLDDEFPHWGESRYVRLTLRGTVRLSDALNQLYVLLPVLDDGKHYWVASDEVDKLVRAGSGWLAAHPERELISKRYLAHRKPLQQEYFDRLAEAGGDTPEELDPAPAADEADAPPPLRVLRHQAVLSAVADTGAQSVIDLGCGPGQLLSGLIALPGVQRVAGSDVSVRALQIAQRRTCGKVELFQGALTYADQRFAGFDAAVLMEVIEHVDLPRLPALEAVVFGTARPRAVIVTTPNREYNIRYEGLTGFRHGDHRFEWSRAEFQDWAARIGETYGYETEFRPVGEDDPEVGPSTQLVIFRKGERA